MFKRYTTLYSSLRGSREYSYFVCFLVEIG
nr:MAG TPA: hypothetical protein [Caudoviricetes sp.]